MNNDRIIRELSALHQRIYRLESELKNLDFSQHDESTAKIDYLAMMTDVEMEEEEENDL